MKAARAAEKPGRPREQRLETNDVHPGSGFVLRQTGMPDGYDSDLMPTGSEFLRQVLEIKLGSTQERRVKIGGDKNPHSMFRSGENMMDAAVNRTGTGPEEKSLNLSRSFRGNDDTGAPALSRAEINRGPFFNQPA
jgi:hypothetical protein